MSRHWQFFSFSIGRFQQVFGKATDQEETALLKILEFEMGAEPDDEIGQLARKLMRQGINYQGMPPREAEVVDQILAVAFSQEGLWNELELEQEMPDGLPHQAVLDLLKRASAAKLDMQLLPLLKGGRRWQATGPTECHYVLFERAEVPKLSQEARAAVETPGTWSSLDAPNQIMDGLIMVCEFTARKHRPLAGILV
ncbi:MAG TPA: hypothetical protein PKD86_02065 [Gemmatales bacterium]|nr:hypothetical protein [Gemmatales bacterium]HMP58114.1 hypothetical protein [Gemmatales bacterium]